MDPRRALCRTRTVRGDLKSWMPSSQNMVTNGRRMHSESHTPFHVQSAPLIIHPETEVHQYDEEFTVTVGDWYHQEHSVLIKQFINVANPGGAEPVPGKLRDTYILFEYCANVSLS